MTTPLLTTTRPLPSAAPSARPVVQGHRPELDGLRTVAVYLVLLFHAGVGWFAGGFVGVDLFFVLSGFLVSSLLVSELEATGSLRLGRFYARRVRRLLPAAVVCIVVTSLVFTLLWSVVRRASLVGDAVSALLYYANVHFLNVSGGYFSQDVDKSPFLHFWSLSIEEQFYAFFPVLLLLVFRLARHRRRVTLLAVVGGVFVMSLAAQLWWATHDADRAYYGTDSRLYQLLAGALLTVVLTATSRRPAPRLAHAAAVTGLGGLVLVATGLVDLSPSWRGICAAAAAVLVLGGLAPASGGPIAWVLSTRPMVYLGRISYGTYLWHWPVILALGTLLHTGPWATAALAFGLATGLAALSAELLELPIRRTPRLDPMPWTVVVGGLALSAFVAVTVVPNVLHSLRRPAVVAAGTDGTTLSRSAGLARELAATPPALDYRQLGFERGRPQTCSAGQASACELVHGHGPTVLLVGDSQAETFVPVFERLAREHDLSLDVDAIAGCPWQEQLTNDKLAASTDATCAAARVGWYDDVLPRLHPDVVVLLGRPRDDPQEWGDLVRRRDGRQMSLDQAVWTSTRSTLRKVVDVAPAVVIQRQIMPETFQPADCLAAARRVGQCVVNAPAGPSPTDSFVTTLAMRDQRIHPVDLNPVFCPTAPVCSPIQHGQLVWTDDHHYTTEYAMRMRGRLWQALVATGTLG